MVARVLNTLILIKYDCESAVQNMDETSCANGNDIKLNSNCLQVNHVYETFNRLIYLRK